MQRAKQEAERLAAEGRENEARAHDLAKRHQGLLSEVETHTRTLQQARTDAEKHMNCTHLLCCTQFLMYRRVQVRDVLCEHNVLTL